MLKNRNKNNLVECYFPNCPLGNWKNFVFSLLTGLKEQGLSQNKLIKIKPKINNNDRVNRLVKTEKKLLESQKKQQKEIRILRN